MKFLLLLLVAISAYANQRAQGYCEQGNKTVVITSGLSGTPKVQASYPQCTVTVFAAGTTNLATIYSDRNNTALANPFTASTTGLWFFYASTGNYDVRLSGGGIPAPFTIGDILIADPTSPSGEIVMRRSSPTSSATWIVTLPSGAVLPTPGDICQGAQTALNYAWSHGYKFRISGAGVTTASGTPPSTLLSMLTCTDTLAFPTGNNNFFEASNIFLVLNPTNPAHDGITYDTMDTTTVLWHNTQLVYSGTAAVQHFLPAHDNGETFAGFTTSHVDTGHTICSISGTNFGPDPTKGTGIRISAPALGLGLANGNGIFTGMTINGEEINQCLVGLLIDNPGGSGSIVTRSTISNGQIHGQNGTSFKEGTSAAAAGLITGNHYHFPIDSVGAAVSLWGGTSINAGGNIYVFSNITGNTGITFNSSACGANVTVGAIGTTVANYVNSATCQTNHVHDTISPIVTQITPSGSPFTYTNQSLKESVVSINNGTISLIEYAADGSTFVQVAATGPMMIPMFVGSKVRVTYSVVPNMFHYE